MALSCSSLSILPNRLFNSNISLSVSVHVVIDNDKGRKWQYRANYAMGIHICVDFFRYIGDEPPDSEEKIGHYILPIRPNRADRRKVVPKQVAFFLYRVA